MTLVRVIRKCGLPHWRAPCKGGASQWVQAPPGKVLQPEVTGAVMESGSGNALLRCRPLRTGHESHPSSGSSHSSAPLSGTERANRMMIRGSTVSEVRLPSRIKWIRGTAYFGVPND